RPSAPAGPPPPPPPAGAPAGTGPPAPPPMASPRAGAAIRRLRNKNERRRPVNGNELSGELTRAFPGAPGDLGRLRARLAAAAQQDGILDVAYRTVDSPVGPLLLAATEAGLVRVAY